VIILNFNIFFEVFILSSIFLKILITSNFEISIFEVDLISYH